jgi:hypothetical protein
VWIEMRSRADTLGIAEKPPKTRSDKLGTQSASSSDRPKLNGNKP